MKRSLLFGLLLALFGTVPYLRGLVTFAFIIQKLHPLTNGLIIHKSDLEAYTLLTRVVDYEHIRPILVAIPVTLYLFIFLLFYTTGWFRLIRGKAEKIHWPRLLILLVPSIAIIYAASKSYFALVNPKESPGFILSYYHPAEALTAYAILSAPDVAVMFLLGTVLFALLKYRDFAEARGSLVAVMIASTVFAGVLGYAWHYQDARDISKNLTDIPGVTDDVEPFSILPLDGGPGAITVDSEYSFDEDQHAPLSESNAAAIRGYLESTGYGTALSVFGMDYLAEWDLIQLDKGAAAKEYMDLFRLIGNPVDGKMALAMTAPGYHNTNHLAMLDDLAKDDRLVIRGLPALAISRAYARYGRLDEARSWYDKGTEGPGSVGEEIAIKYHPPVRPPFYGGAVTGRLMVGGAEPKRIRIGIFHADKVTNLRERSGEGLLSVSFLAGLLDGKAVSTDGSFDFTGLPVGEYVLLLSAPDVDGKTYRAVNSPGIIAITKDNPRADAGEVRLVVD